MGMAGRRKESRLTGEQTAHVQQGIEFLVDSGYIRRYARIAEMLGVTESTMSHWRAGRSKPSIEEYNKIMDLVEQAKKFLKDAGKTATSIHDNVIGNGIAVNSEPMIKAEAVCNALRLRLVQAINNMTDIDDSLRQRLTKLVLEG